MSAETAAVSALRCEDIEVRFGALRAVGGVTLDFAAGGIQTFKQIYRDRDFLSFAATRTF